MGAGSWIPAPHSPQPGKIKGIDDALLGPSPFGVAFAPLVGLRLSLVHAPELSGRGRRRGRGSRSAVGIAPGGAGIRRLLSRLDLDSRFLSSIHRVGDEAETVGGGPRGPRFQVVFIFVRVLLRGFAAGGASPLPAPRVVGKIHFESSPFPLKRPKSRRPAPWAPVWISGRRQGGHTPPRPERGGGGGRQLGSPPQGQRAAAAPVRPARPLHPPRPPATPRSRAPHCSVTGVDPAAGAGRTTDSPGTWPRRRQLTAPRGPQPRRKRARLAQGDRSIHHARPTAERAAPGRAGSSARPAQRPPGAALQAASS